MSYGWNDIDTVMTVARGVHYMLQTCLKMPIPLIICTVNNALCHVIRAFQFIDVTYTTVADKLAAE